jgi:excisionase family DNA binding protein
MTDRLMTHKDLAEYLQVSEDHVKALRKQGLPSVKISPHIVRFVPAQVTAWLEQR